MTFGQFLFQLHMNSVHLAVITFLISFVVAMAVLFAKYFGAAIPGLTSDGMQFAGMVVAYLLLVLG